MDIVYRFDPFHPISRRVHPDARSALRALEDGNDRFVRIVNEVQREIRGEEPEHPVIVQSDPLSLAFPVWGDEAPRQAPFAAVLGCSDARAPVEVIFDQGCNDLFVVRVAGNVLGVEGVGSMQYAVEHMSDGLRAIVVLGHSGCGAVSAAVSAYLSPKDFGDIAFSHSLRSLVDRVMIAVRGAASSLQRVAGADIAKHPRYPELLTEASVYSNAAVTAYDLQRALKNEKNTLPSVVFGVYDLVTQRVRALPGGLPGTLAFQEAPQDPDDFVVYGTALAECLLATEYSA
jgi:carbonic anhydrase